MFIVLRKEKSRSQNAVQKVAYYPVGMIYKTRKSADKEANRLHKLYKINSWYLGMEIREIPWD